VSSFTFKAFSESLQLYDVGTNGDGHGSRTVTMVYAANAHSMKGCSNAVQRVQCNPCMMHKETSSVCKVVRFYVCPFAGNLSYALKLYRRALEEEEAMHGRDHIRSADTLMNMGLAYSMQGMLLSTGQPFA
jgi:hypothetical protein